MRIPFCLILFLFTDVAFPQENEQTSANKLFADCSFSLNSNGMASIPAFSLGKPAIIASVNLAKGRLSYDPNLAYSLDMKPWFIDNWFHYKMIRKPQFELKAGVNFSTFCSGLMLNGEEITRAERYLAFSINPAYNFSPVSSLAIDYWSDNGIEKGSISGHFMSLAYDRSEIRIGEKMFFSVNLMVFQILYEGKNDGLFFSPSFSAYLKYLPATLFFQATQSITSNIPDLETFRWNVGMRFRVSD